MSTSQKPPGFDFATAPLAEAQRRLRDLEDITARARQAINLRLALVPKKWRCWSQSHLKDGVVPKSVLAQCRGEVQDGRWVHKDDGAKDGDGNISPIVCCSQKCTLMYQDWSTRRRASERGVSGLPRIPIPGVPETGGAKA